MFRGKNEEEKATAASSRARRLARNYPGASRLRRGAVITRRPGSAAPGDSLTLAGSFAPLVLPGAIARWTPQLREIPSVLGFGGLNHMRPMGKVDRQFSTWLLSKLDPDTMCLRLRGDVVKHMRESDIESIMGIKAGGRKICIGSRDDAPDLLEKVNKMLGNHESPHLRIKVTDLRKIMEAPVPEVVDDDYLDRMKVAYTLLAVSTFLAPKSVNPKVCDELLPCVEDPSKISEYNWAGYMLDVIREGARKLQQDLKKKCTTVLLCGCLLFIQIFYLEGIAFGEGAEDKEDGGPVILKYGASKLSQLIALDTIETENGKEYGRILRPSLDDQMDVQLTPAPTLTFKLDEVAMKVIGDLVLESSNWNFDDVLEATQSSPADNETKKRKLKQILSAREKRHKTQLAQCLTTYLDKMKSINLARKNKTPVDSNNPNTRDPAYVSAMQGIDKTNMFYPGTPFLGAGSSKLNGMHPNMEAITIASDRASKGIGIRINDEASVTEIVPDTMSGLGKGKNTCEKEIIQYTRRRVLFDSSKKSNKKSMPLGEGSKSAQEDGVVHEDNENPRTVDDTQVAGGNILPSAIPDECGASGTNGHIGNVSNSLGGATVSVDEDNIIGQAEVVNEFVDGIPITNYTINSINDYVIVEEEVEDNIANGQTSNIPTPTNSEAILNGQVTNMITPKSSGRKKLVIRLSGSSRRIPATFVGPRGEDLDLNRVVPLYGRSPFDLGRRHKTPIRQVVNVFYENVMYCLGSELSKTWYKCLEPYLLMMTGRKLKYQFGIVRELEYNTMNAGVRMLNKKELEMMSGTGEVPWRFNGSPDISLHFLVDPHNINIASTECFFNADVLGFSVNKCRMIQLPVMVRNSWCLYVFDMLSRRLNVLDPTYTKCTESKYQEKHACTISFMLLGLQTCGQAMSMGWDAIHKEDWKVQYNKGMHDPCVSEDSGVFVLHYMREFDGVDLQRNLPESATIQDRRCAIRAMLLPLRELPLMLLMFISFCPVQLCFENILFLYFRQGNWF